MGKWTVGEGTVGKWWTCDTPVMEQYILDSQTLFSLLRWIQISDLN